MASAKLVNKDNEQFVILPEECRFPGDEVYIEKVGSAVVILPKYDPWKPLFDSLSMFSNDFMANGREQPPHQEREPF